MLKGLGTALVTPFANGQIDYTALERLIEHQIAGGVDYVVSLGTTGESVTLTKQEKYDLVRFTVDRVKDRIAVVAGLGGNDTAVLCRQVEDFDLKGVTAILSSSPAYNKPSQEGIYQHFMKVAAASPLPIIVYNVPGRTSSNILPDTILRLANDSDKITGIKEASGDIVQGAEIVRRKPDDFVVISGDDPTALGLMAVGGEGCISVISNAWPARWQEVIGGALKGDWEKARQTNLDLLPVHNWLYIDGNPAGIKAALNQMGMINDELRLPLVPMSEANRNGLNKAIDFLIG